MPFVTLFVFVALLVGYGEVYVLLRVANEVGFLATVLLCVVTALIGGALVRLQGLITLLSIQRDLSRGQLPATEIVAGMMLLVVGALLITPGFLTDTFGFLLLVPTLRRRAAGKIVRRLKRHITLRPPTAPPFAEPATPQNATEERIYYREIIDIEAD